MMIRYRSLAIHIHRTHNILWQFMHTRQENVSSLSGVQHIIYGCYDKNSDEKLEDESCQYVDSKEADDVECEMIDCASVT